MRDVREDRIDKAIASHVLNLHMHAARDESADSDVSLELMRKYLTYAKMKMRPTLSEEA